jgi:hypothetical protein
VLRYCMVRWSDISDLIRTPVNHSVLVACAHVVHKFGKLVLDLNLFGPPFECIFLGHRFVGFKLRANALLLLLNRYPDKSPLRKIRKKKYKITRRIT